MCGEFVNNSGGWVHSVAFSPSGNSLAFAAHDSSITVVYPSAPDQPPQAVLTVTTPMLPFLSLTWLNENELVAGGHDCQPVVFHGDNTGWSMAYSVDDPSKNARVGKESSALNMFRQMDLKGKDSSVDDTTLRTVHQNTIVYVYPIRKTRGPLLIDIVNTEQSGRMRAPQETSPSSPPQGMLSNHDSNIWKLTYK